MRCEWRLRWREAVEFVPVLSPSRPGVATHSLHNFMTYLTTKRIKLLTNGDVSTLVIAKSRWEYVLYKGLVFLQISFQYKHSLAISC